MTSPHHQAETGNFLKLHSFPIDGDGKGSKPPAAPSGRDAGPVPGPAAEQGTWAEDLPLFPSPFLPPKILSKNESNPRCGPETAAVPFLRLSKLCCVSGKDMKTPTGSIQQPAMGVIMPTKATSGSRWPGRMTEVWASPLGLGMEATCSLQKRQYFL